MINMLKIFYYILIKLFIIGIFYFVVSKLSYEIDFNEDYTRNVGFSPIWKLHKENNWICVNTSNKDLTEDYHKGLCSINIGAEKSVYFIGDSHTGHLRGTIDTLINTQNVNIFHTYRYSCPFYEYADRECLIFYKNAFDYVKKNAQKGDEVVLSYFYRPYTGVWGDYNVPRKNISEHTRKKNIVSMVKYANQINEELIKSGVSLRWILNGPSPNVAPFVLKHQNRWPKFADNEIFETNFLIKSLVDQKSSINIIDLLHIWNQIPDDKVNLKLPCQRISDRDNHHISYKYATMIFNYVLKKDYSEKSTNQVIKNFNANC